MKILNCSRQFVAKEATKETLHRLGPGPWAWIFIGEPIDGLVTSPDSEFRFNYDIQRLPKLEIRFWDITKPKATHILIDGEFKEETIYPINAEQSKELYTFLKANKDKNIIVSCYAGKCRSGAVAQFAHEYFGYEWIESFKGRSSPNDYVYDQLVKIWKEDLYDN